MRTFTVLGSGAWATTMAKMIAENGHRVWLCCHRSEYVQSINTHHINSLSLPNVTLPDTLTATLDFDQSIQESEAIILGVPSRYVLPYLDRLTASPKRPTLSIVKGILDNPEWLLSTYFKQKFSTDLAILSGPNLAKEIADQNPAATVIACEASELSIYFQTIISRPYFRVYTSPDRVGVELGGILKNVMAIAAGVCDGLGLGANAKAALLTRGLREMGILGTHLGAKPSTLYGLSGLGDLMATCHSEQSRNWQIGHRISLGKTIDATSLGSAVPEGIRTALFFDRFAKQEGLDLPIISAVGALITSETSPQDTIYTLMNRELKSET